MGQDGPVGALHQAGTCGAARTSYIKHNRYNKCCLLTGESKSGAVELALTETTESVAMDTKSKPLRGKVFAI